MRLFLRLEDEQKSCVKLADIIKSSLLSGFYLLVVKKRHRLSIYILVVYLIIRMNIMVSINLSCLPMLNAAWIHVAAFGLVFMLGVKKNIVPVTLYSGSLILQLFLSLDNSVDDTWDTPRLSQYIYIHGISLPKVSYFY